MIFPSHVSKSTLTFISLQIYTNLTFWIWYFTTQYLDEKATIIWILIRNILLQISSLLRNHSYFTLDSDFDGMWIYWKVHLHSFLYDSLIFDFTTIAKDRPCLKTTCWIGIAGFKDNSEIIGNFRIFKNFQAIEPRNRKRKVEFCIWNNVLKNIFFWFFFHQHKTVFGSTQNQPKIFMFYGP